MKFHISAWCMISTIDSLCLLKSSCRRKVYLASGPKKLWCVICNMFLERRKWCETCWGTRSLQHFLHPCNTSVCWWTTLRLLDLIQPYIHSSNRVHTTKLISMIYRSGNQYIILSDFFVTACVRRTDCRFRSIAQSLADM